MSSPAEASGDGDQATVVLLDTQPTEVTAGSTAEFKGYVWLDNGFAGNEFTGQHVKNASVTFSIAPADQAYATVSNSATATTGGGIGSVTAVTVLPSAQQVIHVIATGNVPAGFTAPAPVTLALTVHSRVAGITITNPSTPTTSLRVGDTPIFTAVANLAPGAPTSPAPQIQWASSNPQFATVDAATGKVTAVAPSNGQAVTITASSEGASASVALTVGAALAPTSVTVTKSDGSPVSANDAKLTVGGPTLALAARVLDQNNNPLTGQAVTWQVDNSGIATVTSAGVVSAVAPGTTNVRAVLASNPSIKSPDVTITVAAPTPTVASVKLFKNGSTPVAATGEVVAVGTTLPLTAKAFDASGTEIPGQQFTWSTPNPNTDKNIATVTSTGVVVGAGPGTVAVTAASVSNPNAKASVTIVVPTPAGGAPTVLFTVPQVAITHTDNDPFTIGLTGYTAAGDPATLPTGASATWASPGGIATTTGQGATASVKGTAVGNTLVTAVYQPTGGGSAVTAATALQVRGPGGTFTGISSLTLSAGTTTLKVGAAATAMRVVMKDPQGRDITNSVTVLAAADDPRLVSITPDADPTGYFFDISASGTPPAGGKKVTVTVTVNNVKSATIDFTVVP